MPEENPYLKMMQEEDKPATTTATTPAAQVKQPGIIETAQNTFDEMMQPRLHSRDQDIAGNIGTGALNVAKGIGSLVSPVVHPLATIASFGGMLQNPYGPEAQALIKPFIEYPAEAAEMTLGQLLGGKVAGGIGGRVASVLDPISEYHSPFIPQEEAIARRGVDILKPGQYETGNVRSGLEKHFPYIQAKAPGGAYENPLEFSKAASAAGQEQTGAIKNLAEQASQNDPTIGQNYGELYDINQKLRPIYRSRTMGETMTKEVQDNMQALENRRNALNENFYSRLSAQTGLPEDVLAEINQRGGALQHIGDVTDWAQAARRQGVGAGQIPLTKTGLLQKIVEGVQGGPERIAGRQLTRLGKLVTPVENALPDLNALRGNIEAQGEAGAANAAQNRATAGMRIPSAPARSDVIPETPFDPSRELAARESRLTGRKAAIGQRREAEVAEDRAQRLVEQQRLAKAREQQRQAGVVREYRGGQ